MEWAVLAIFAGVAAVCIGLPWTRKAGEVEGVDALIERRLRLLADLAELDHDLAEGRIAGADRLEGRRALAPALREVSEQLRARGEAGGAREVGA